MRKIAGSSVVVWKSAKRDSFNLKIETLDILLTVSAEKQPKSYEKVKEWFENDEIRSNPIVFSGE
ncbi:hypothetical protein [Bacillus sp. AFS040349]|uniref:hypothetical protein n=1 Tax=Bacillus sp. AFS040349 TaxID=2033502 RepID=UPI000BFE6227|nr:hypothetical protein [Bacillus sp. AFS040349]PGT81566.1 hypothetical protein COD11_17245 [Bacillus sp. AFS040349]